MDTSAIFGEQSWFQTEEEMEEFVPEREIEARELKVSRMH